MNIIKRIINAILNNSSSEVEELKRKNRDLSSKIKSLEQLEQENQKLRIQINSLQHKGDKNEIAPLKTEGTSLKNSKIAEIEKLESMIAEFKIKNAKLEEENKELYTEKKLLEENLNKYREISSYLKNYETMADKFKKCDSLEKLAQKIKSDNRDEELLKFIGIFGNGEDFLRDVYITFKEKKLAEKLAVTSEENEFIDCINEFFKKNYAYDSDVLRKVNPGEDKFDKAVMQDILKPADFNFKIVEEFYIPGVKTQSYNFKAIVRGRK